MMNPNIKQALEFLAWEYRNPRNDGYSADWYQLQMESIFMSMSDAEIVELAMYRAADRCKERPPHIQNMHEIFKFIAENIAESLKFKKMGIERKPTEETVKNHPDTNNCTWSELSEYCGNDPIKWADMFRAIFKKNTRGYVVPDHPCMSKWFEEAMKSAKQ